MSDCLRSRLQQLIAVTFPVYESKNIKNSGKDSSRQNNNKNNFPLVYSWPLNLKRGKHTLCSFLELEEKEQEIVKLNHLDLQKIIFLDTETTGLAGGTGTLAFLIGCGYFKENRFEMKQFFVRDHAEEAEVLEELRPLLEQAEAIITYNGKSFDWPLLQSRFILNRIALKNSILLNIDLLYFTRMLWRNTLPDCRLATVEKFILNIGKDREGDIPGWLIPSMYFNYLREGDFASLSPVFKHNRLDIITLVTLAVEVASTIAYPLEKGCAEHKDLLQIGKYWDKIGNKKLSLQCYYACLRNKDQQFQAMLRIALLYKQNGEWQKAALFWKELIEKGSLNIEPFIELAKVNEHQWKRYKDALKITEEAEIIIRQRKKIGDNKAKQIELDLKHRKNRLINKIKKAERIVL